MSKEKINSKISHKTNNSKINSKVNSKMSHKTNNSKTNNSKNKEKFYDLSSISAAGLNLSSGAAAVADAGAGEVAQPETTYSDVIAFFSISPTAGTAPTQFADKLQDYVILLLKYGFLVLLLTVNFLGLSVSLNCNSDQEFSIRVVSAIFAFFFGFIYLIVNYYTYKVLGQGKICKMNRDKLFPFKT